MDSGLGPSVRPGMTASRGRLARSPAAPRISRTATCNRSTPAGSRA